MERRARGGEAQLSCLSHLLAGFHLARVVLVELANVDKHVALEFGDDNTSLVGELRDDCQPARSHQGRGGR